MGVITLQSVKKDFGIKEILKDASFSLDADEKVGLIGTNGSGKSTLLKMIAGMEPIDGGEIIVNPGAKVIYLPQQPDLDESRTVLEQIFADSGEQMNLVREYEEISDKLAKNPQDNQLLSRLGEVTQRMDMIGAWEVETNAKIILSQLGITDFDAIIGTLSGGYRKRIALATALLSEPDLLLMDEPTNHLDADSVEWLQSYLNRRNGALLLITHDRYFLDKVTNRIIEIDRGDFYTYSGNYSYYLQKKAEAEESAASSQQKFKGVLRRELEWLKKGPKARSTKQKARIDRVREMQGTEFKQTQGKVEISTASRRIGKKVIEVNNISKAYGDASGNPSGVRTLFKDFTYEFSPEDRVGIIGENGAGKSTLINIITGREQPDTGEVDIGTTVYIGYFDQHSEELIGASNDSQRVIDYIKQEGAEFIETADGTRISASQMLERFLFPPSQQYAPIDKLSGGEKRRLFLLRILMSAPNVLILDEPTNDLDVQTLAVLEDYLEDFKGCVIVVSHDRYFLDRTIDRIFAFEDTKIREFPGNYSVYLDFKRAEEAKEKQLQAELEKEKPKYQTQKIETKVTKEDNKKKRRLSNWERKEFEQLEGKIAQLEDDKAEAEMGLTKAAGDYSKVKELYEKVEKLKQDIDKATERWMELAEIDE